MADIVTKKYDREADNLTVEWLEREVIGLGVKDIDQINNSYGLVVMR